MGSSSGVTQEALKSPNNVWLTTSVKCCQPGKLIRDSGPRDLWGYWSWRHPLPGVFPNPRLLEGASVQHKPHCLCSVGAASPLSLSGRNPPQIQIPKRQPRANFASRKAVRPAILTLFCTEAYSRCDLFIVLLHFSVIGGPMKDWECSIPEKKVECALQKARATERWKLLKTHFSSSQFPQEY